MLLQERRSVLSWHRWFTYSRRCCSPGRAGFLGHPVVLAALLAACIAAGVALSTSASITAGGSTSVTGMVTVVAYGLFAVGVLTAALVDVVERRIPNRITYPLIVIGVLGLPW